MAIVDNGMSPDPAAALAVLARLDPASPSLPPAAVAVGRDAAARGLYLAEALPDIPRLLGAIDRNPYRATYGCLDRQFWHYRTSSFPSEMYQEGALALALAYAHPLPGNRWHGLPRVRELAIAAVRFAARAAHPDGSCDDYYPYERALGAAVFSLAAAARTCQILAIDLPEVTAWLKRRARWLIDHDESGVLTNHHALAAWGLWNVAALTGQPEFREASRQGIDRVLSWQDPEGWFEEYGGADPGYQTVTIDCLAKYRCASGDSRVDEPLGRAVDFARRFLHPDGSYGGEYGSRGTYHFYPHGMELLAGHWADAADLADGHLQSLSAGTQAAFRDDRLFAHRTANLLEAYLDWSPQRPRAAADASQPLHVFPHAGIVVLRDHTRHAVISAARGGIFKYHAVDRPVVGDAGLILETTAGRVAVTQHHDRSRPLTVKTTATADRSATITRIDVSAMLHWTRFETATPVKQAIFPLGMVTVGRWCRTAVRRLLQRRLITGRQQCPALLHRTIEIYPDAGKSSLPRLRVIDRLELLDPQLQVRRMSFGVDHQAAYVAACGVYQDSVLEPWTDLSSWVAELNERRQVEICREFA